MAGMKEAGDCWTNEREKVEFGEDQDWFKLEAERVAPKLMSAKEEMKLRLKAKERRRSRSEREEDESSVILQKWCVWFGFNALYLFKRLSKLKKMQLIVKMRKNGKTFQRRRAAGDWRARLFLISQLPAGPSPSRSPLILLFHSTTLQPCHSTICAIISFYFLLFLNYENEIPWMNE